MFSIREHTTICVKIEEKTNSFRGNIFIDRKKKKNCAKKKIFSLEWRACMLDIAQYFSTFFDRSILSFLISKQTNNLTITKIYNSKDFHLRLLFVRNLVIFMNMLINSCLPNYTFHLLSTHDKFSITIYECIFWNLKKKSLEVEFILAFFFFQI